MTSHDPPNGTIFQAYKITFSNSTSDFPMTLQTLLWRKLEKWSHKHFFDVQILGKQKDPTETIKDIHKADLTSS